MNKDDIKVGGEYLINHTSGLIKVRVVDIYSPRNHVIRYKCVNLNTGRNIVVKSTVRFKYLPEVGQ